MISNISSIGVRKATSLAGCACSAMDNRVKNQRMSEGKALFNPMVVGEDEFLVSI